MKQLVPGGVVLTVILLCTGMPASVAAFGFNQPEINLIEPDYDAFDQINANVCFDPSGNVHVVYNDDRAASNPHIFATTYTAGGALTPSYRAYQGVDTDEHVKPFIFPSSYYTDRSYIGALENTLPVLECVMGYINTTSLPAVPPNFGVDSYTLAGTTIENLDMVAGGFFVFYVYSSAGTLHLNAMDEQTGSWGSEITLTSANPDENYIAASLAMDDEGYLYLAYDVFDVNLTQSYLRIRRSMNPHSVGNWEPERDVDYYMGSGAFMPRVAATGIGGTDLKVAVAYFNLNIPDPVIIGNMEPNGNWTIGPANPFLGSGPYNISSILAAGQTIEGPDIAYDAADGLYVVWSDDRDAIFKIYGNASFDGGVSMNSANEVQIGPGIQGISGAPRLATGNAPGDIAIAYSRNNGSFTNPYLLVNRATFFDSCDADPATTGYWTTASGVSVDPGLYFSDPASYKMETSKRGTLLRDFGTSEMQGSLMLQFYDSMASEDFYAALRNDNLRGVIRMLGVKNDVTPSTYKYSSDGIVWQDLGAPRSMGWHAIRMVVNDSGIVMSIESGGTEYSSPLDPAFTSFTGVELDGGGPGGTYNVDDIRVEAYPMDLLMPVPSASPMMLLVGLAGIGVLIIRRLRS